MAKITNIEELLDAIEESIPKSEDLSLENVLDSIGHRSFGPLLLIAGLVMAAPAIGDIPGVPTGTGIFSWRSSPVKCSSAENIFGCPSGSWSAQ